MKIRILRKLNCRVIFVYKNGILFNSPRAFKKDDLISKNPVYTNTFQDQMGEKEQKIVGNPEKMPVDEWKKTFL